MKSVDELRKWANGLSGIWIDPNDHSIIVTTCDDMPPSMDCVSLREHVSGILDGIEREFEDMVRSLTIDAIPATDENMADAGWVRLPVDADGEPWHVGDMTENGNVVNGMTIDFHGWHFTGTRNDIDPAIHRHYVPKPTVEDVLREFYTLAVRGKKAHAEDVDNAALAEYAAKLRLAGDGE